MKNKWIEFFCWFLSFFLGYTAFKKFLAIDEFKTALIQSPLIFNELVDVLAWIIPVLLLAISVSLLLVNARKNALLLSSFLFLVFSLYTGGIVFLAHYQPCSCGGIAETISWEMHFVINILFSIASFLTYYFSPINPSHR